MDYNFAMISNPVGINFFYKVNRYYILYSTLMCLYFIARILKNRIHFVIDTTIEKIIEERNPSI